MTAAGRRALLRIGAAAVCAAGVARVGTAAEPPPGELVRTGLYRLPGDGGNTLMRYTGAGIVLVDGQPASGHAAVMAQLRRINRLGDQPLRLLLLTNARDRRAGSAALLAARVPVIAQRNARARLLARGTVPEAALHGFDDVHALHVGGVALTLRHWHAAVTDGDAVVHFKDQGVVAVGDLYTDATPQPDLDAGGSWSGWAATLRALLQIDFQTFVAADGAALPRAALEAFAARLSAFVARGRAIVAAGVGPAALAATLDAAAGAGGWRFAFDADAAARLHADLATPAE